MITISIVLKTSGKGSSVDYAEVHLFGDDIEANEFIQKTNEKKDDKYWEYAEIVNDGEKIVLQQPDQNILKSKHL